MADLQAKKLNVYKNDDETWDFTVQDKNEQCVNGMNLLNKICLAYLHGMSFGGCNNIQLCCILQSQ